MGEAEFGKCDICRNDASLQRTYYYYDIKCDCHSPQHFELVRHCSNCIPKPPLQTIVNIRPITPGSEGEGKEDVILKGRLEDGHNYLMTVRPDDITIEDCLEAFGYSRNGLEG